MNRENARPSTPSDGQQHVDLKARAHVEMLAAGFAPDFEPQVKSEIAKLNLGDPAKPSANVRDLRSLLWSSIDNPESKDLDQIEYAESLANGQSRLMIAIADVDALVSKGSATDKHALQNTTSVYTGIVTYPMLPDELSFDRTSLLQDKDREAIVIDLVLDANGLVVASDIYLGLVCNRAKLDYISIGTWLENGGTPPDKVSQIKGLSEQLLLQNELKQRIHDQRDRQGSLHLHTLETTTIARDGVVLDLEEVEENPARDLIENFMISGNIAVSHFLEGKKLPSIRRVVKTPERWDRIVQVAATYSESLPAQPDGKALAQFLLKQRDADPLHFPDLSLTIVKLLGRGEYTVEVPGQMDQGHFALAVHDYTHATAPNRRYADLVTQRLVKAAIARAPAPYKLDELKDVALACTRKEDDAKKVERTMRKVAAAVLLAKHIGEVYEGVITGVKDDAVFVRIFKPPTEGRVMKGFHGLDVGDKVKVRLLATDPENAYIDFACISHQS
jgi:VacB/RNase II family 3'-5' exoribonuclease